MGRPKPLARLGGRTLLDRVLATLRRSPVASIVVVLGDRADTVRRAGGLDGTTVVENPRFAEGMSRSLKVGLAARPAASTHALIVLADQPLIAPSTIATLVAAAASGNGRIFVPTYRGVRGNPVLFDAALAPELDRVAGDVGCRGIFPDHPHELREVPVDDPGVLVDVDTPAELDRLERAMASGRPIGPFLATLAAARLVLHAAPTERPAPRRVWRPVEVAALAEELRAERRPFALATVVRAVRPTSGRPGFKAVVRPDGSYVGWVGGACTEHLLVAEARSALRDGVPRLLRVSPDGTRKVPEEGIVDRPMVCESGGTVEVYIEPNVPKPDLVIVGDSPVATNLAALAPVVGFRVTLVAPGALGRDLPEVAELVGDLADLPRVVRPDSFVVVASMGKYDESALGAVAPVPVAFVGLVASRTRAASVLAGLRESGLSDAELRAIRNPVGLDLGAETPEEIALSVLAELVRSRRARPPPSAPAPSAAAGSVEGPAIDPVCHMEVERTSPLTAEHAGTTYYFCADGCRRKFRSHPKRFLASA